jgi:hypothetical protein
MPFDGNPPAEVTARDRMIQLRDFLAALPDERFSMRHVFTAKDKDIYHLEQFHECGTAACIFGYACVLWPEVSDGMNQFPIVEHLWLSNKEACQLFTPPGWYDDKDAKQYTRAMAVAVLDHFLATGKIDWSVATPKES